MCQKTNGPANQITRKVPSYPPPPRPPARPSKNVTVRWEELIEYEQPLTNPSLTPTTTPQGGSTMTIGGGTWGTWNARVDQKLCMGRTRLEVMEVTWLDNAKHHACEGNQKRWENHQWKSCPGRRDCRSTPIWVFLQIGVP